MEKHKSVALSELFPELMQHVPTKYYLVHETVFK